MATCKLGEKGCWKDGKCHYSRNCENKVLTNADSIRSLSDEELAEWIARTQIKVMKDLMNLLRIPYDEPDDLVEKGKTEALQWLKQPAE